MTIPKFTRIICLLCVTAMLISALAGCAGASSGAVHDGADQESPAPERPGNTEEQVTWAGRMSARETEDISRTMDIDTFDERFLEYLSRTRTGNYMASPLSFRYALGLLLAGAAGETKAQLLSALGVSSEEEWISHCLDFNGFVATFAADLDADSLDLYQILMAVEDEFRIKVDEEKAMQIGTVEEALEMIRNARGEEQ